MSAVIKRRPFRMPNRRGVVSLQVTNVLNSSFNYQDDNNREFSDEPSVGPHIPAHRDRSRNRVGSKFKMFSRICGAIIATDFRS